MCQRLCKLLGKEMSNLAFGEKLATLDLSVAGNGNSVVGLLFVSGPLLSFRMICYSRPEMLLEKNAYNPYQRHLVTPSYYGKDDLLRTEKGTEEVKDLRDALVRIRGELRNRNDYSLEIILIPTNQTQPISEDCSGTNIKKLFSQQDCPFFSISSKEASRIQEFITRKFEVTEAPSLILIDACTAEVITFDGKEKLLQDPKGEKFPWKFPSFSKILESGTLVKHKENTQDADKHVSVRNETKPTPYDKELINPDKVDNVIKGVLFAAFWCPPCRSFLAALTALYENVNREQKRLEVIFVSSDRSEESFDRFFSTMPWLAVPFEDDKRRDLLTKAFNVKAIPNFTLLDQDDNVITREGRLEVNDDLEGMDFPWYTRLVDELRERHSSTLNNCLCVIYFTDDSETDYDIGEAVLNPIATEIDKSSAEDACAPKFFIAADSDLAESLRIFMDLEETLSYLVIMDVANSRYAVQTNDSDSKRKISETSVQDFLHKFQTNKIVYKYIQSRFI